MDADFWLSRWRSGDIGFHQPDGHDLLKKHWASIGAAAGATVFVPLAGKTLDLRWLAAQGHTVIGVELSELAIDQFFADSGLTPTTATSGGFIVKSSGPFTMYVGDFFELDARNLFGASAAYDRAALIALPHELRARYSAHMAALLPPGAPALLISVAYPEHEISGPPFSVEPAEIDDIYGNAFDIGVLEARDGLQFSANLKSRGVTRLDETAYLLRRRA